MMRLLSVILQELSAIQPNKMKREFKKFISPLRKLIYGLTGKKPWSYGYNDVRWELIEKGVNNDELLNRFNQKQIPEGFGVGFDERVVEYPWIFSKLSDSKKMTLLDAGSTFNFSPLVMNKKVKNKDVTIYTYYPENENFINNRISYQFGDLRNMPLAPSWFDEVVCQSTIEHVDMDNSIYGYELEKVKDSKQKSYQYLKVVDELIRVLKPGGKLLLTFPYGKFENYGFFQQFDAEMVEKILKKFKENGRSTEEYLLYSKKGWQFRSAEECKDTVSYNPHTGQGKGNDGAAHCRCVCCIEFLKN